jgi:hypothetical protein
MKYWKSWTSDEVTAVRISSANSWQIRQSIERIFWLDSSWSTRLKYLPVCKIRYIRTQCWLAENCLPFPALLHLSQPRLHQYSHASWVRHGSRTIGKRLSAMYDHCLKRERYTEHVQLSSQKLNSVVNRSQKRGSHTSEFCQDRRSPPLNHVKKLARYSIVLPLFQKFWLIHGRSLHFSLWNEMSKPTQEIHQAKSAIIWPAKLRVATQKSEDCVLIRGQLDPVILQAIRDKRRAAHIWRADTCLAALWTLTRLLSL